MGIEELLQKYKDLEERVAQLEFREELIRNRDNIGEVLLAYNVTNEQYTKIMDLMDETRDYIDNQKEVSSAEFETKLIDIFGGDIEAANRSVPIEYHFCEYVAKAFMEDGRWEEVFLALYGDLPKYQFLKVKNND